MEKVNKPTAILTKEMSLSENLATTKTAAKNMKTKLNAQVISVNFILYSKGPFGYFRGTVTVPVNWCGGDSGSTFTFVPNILISSSQCSVLS